MTYRPDAPGCAVPGLMIGPEIVMTAERLQRIGSAAAGIAHDINNHLHLIVNHLSIADVEGAREAVLRCSELTASLLAYTRGGSAPIGLLDPVAFLRHFTASLLLPAGVHLELDIPDSLPPIAADPLSLARALDNLVSNALDAMNNDGILHIRASRRLVEIGDSGPGVPPDLARAIFEPFFTTKGDNGTGLGLAIVRDIMRHHGGSVSLKSEPGQGALFRLHFRGPALGSVNRPSQLPRQHRFSQ